MFQVIAATGAAVATIAVAVLDIACSWPAGGTSAGVRPMSGTINPTVTVALRSLEATEADLQRTVTEAATGRAVATVEDNPAVYVIAQRLPCSRVKFVTKFVADTPSGPTLSVAGNNVGLVASVRNLRPDLPPPVITLHGYRTQTITTGSTTIDLGLASRPLARSMRQPA
jgi:hypothetical protein